MAIPFARAALMSALLALILASCPAAAQDVPSCAEKLIPCAQYINSTATPPTTCCGPLADAAANETKCLCAVLSNKALLKSFNIDPEKGFQLAKRCGVTADQSICAKLASAPTGSTASGSNATTTTAAGQNNSAAQRMNWIGVSGLMSFLFFCWSIIA